jgi:hypothetical protein
VVGCSSQLCPCAVGFKRAPALVTGYTMAETCSHSFVSINITRLKQLCSWAFRVVFELEPGNFS